MPLRRTHMLVGIVGVAAFLATGQIMDLRHGHLSGMRDAPRMLFRSAHIYLLFSSLLNLLLGIYGVPREGGVRRAVQSAGSVLIAAGPVLFVAAFLKEPWRGDLSRPFASVGIYGALAGCVLHLGARLNGR